MKKLLLAIALVLAAIPALAQVNAGAPLVVESCGTVPAAYVDDVGLTSRLTVNTVGQLCTQEAGYTYRQIAAGQATTTIKSGAGVLHSITFNSAAAAMNVTTVYDNTAGSGTVIAIPDAVIIDAPVTVIYDVKFATGLTIVTATANGANMTISYK